MTVPPTWWLRNAVAAVNSGVISCAQCGSGDLRIVIVMKNSLNPLRATPMTGYVIGVSLTENMVPQNQAKVSE